MLSAAGIPLIQNDLDPGQAGGPIPILGKMIRAGPRRTPEIRPEADDGAAPCGRRRKTTSVKRHPVLRDKATPTFTHLPSF